MVAFLFLLLALPGVTSLRIAPTEFENVDDFSSCRSLDGVKDCQVPDHGDVCMDFDLLKNAMEEFDFHDHFNEVCKHSREELWLSDDEGTKKRRPEKDKGTNEGAKKPMMFVHVHKGAGVLVCHIARVHEKVIHPEAVCGGPDDGVGLIGKGHSISCADRKAIFSKQKATFGMIEREVNEDDLCHDDFRYGIVLRDPLALAESMTNFDAICSDQGPKLPHDSWQKHLDCLTQGPDACKHLKSSITGLYHFYDNYLVRILGGSDVFNKPPGSINEEDVQKVIQRLEKFDVVLPFDGAGDLPALLNKMDWGGFKAKKKDSHSHPHAAQRISDEARPIIKARLWADYKVVGHFFPNMVQEHS